MKKKENRKPVSNITALMTYKTILASGTAHSPLPTDH